MFNRQKQQTDPRVDAARRASLAIAWGVAAAVAYLGLISQAVQLIVKATNGQWSGGTVDPGIIHAGSNIQGFRREPYAQLASIVVAALRVAIVATVVLGIIARVPPASNFPSHLCSLSAACWGWRPRYCSLWRWWRIQRMAFSSRLRSITIVIVSILLRLQRGIRRFFRRSPALASLLFAAVTVFYLIISNGANISSLVLAAGGCLALAAGIRHRGVLRCHAGAHRPAAAEHGWRGSRTPRRQALTPTSYTPTSCLMGY